MNEWPHPLFRGWQQVVTFPRIYLKPFTRPVMMGIEQCLTWGIRVRPRSTLPFSLSMQFSHALSFWPKTFFTENSQNKGAKLKTKSTNASSRKILGFPNSSVSKEPTCNAGDPSSIPGSGRSAGEGIGYPLQYSGLENSMDCIVHGVTKSQTRLSNFHFFQKDFKLECFFKKQII